MSENILFSPFLKNILWIKNYQTIQIQLAWGRENYKICNWLLKVGGGSIMRVKWEKSYGFPKFRGVWEKRKFLMLMVYSNYETDWNNCDTVQNSCGNMLHTNICHNPILIVSIQFNIIYYNLFGNVQLGPILLLPAAWEVHPWEAVQV